MNALVCIIMVVVLGSVSVFQVPARAASSRKKPHIVQAALPGEYERCDETCPLPGYSAAPAEAWCANRVQCTSQSDCSCCLFKRSHKTANFVYEADADSHVPREPAAAYMCWCTKRKGQ